MRTGWLRVWLGGVLLVGSGVFVNGTAQAVLVTNSWNTLTSGKWEIGANWSAGSPSQLDADDIITNGFVGSPFRKTIFIDATSAQSNASMSVSNVWVSGSGIIQNNLFITNTSPSALTVFNSLSISNNGFVLVSNSVMRVGNNLFDDGGVQLNVGSVATTNATMYVGYNRTGQITISAGTWLASAVYAGFNANTTGTVWLLDGQLISTSSVTSIGYNGVGSMAVSNGIWQSSSVTIADQTGARGTLTWAGGTNALNAAVLNVGFNASATGAVWMTGGSAVLSNTVVTIGNAGVGQMTVSNADLRILGSLTTVGNAGGSVGTLTFAGGTNVMTSPLLVGNGVGASGAVWMTDSRLVATNSSTTIGNSGVGQMTVSNGMWLGRNLSLGVNVGSQGTLTVFGGTNACTGPLIIGGNGIGTLDLEDGGLVVTNTPANVISLFNELNVDGSVVLGPGGTIIDIADFGYTDIGYWGNGTLTNLGGTLEAFQIVVGTFAGSQGTLTMSAGTITVGQGFAVGNVVNSTGTVWLSGGQIVGGSMFVGDEGVGRMTVSNGTVWASELAVGFSNNGTYTCAGGTNNVFDLEMGFMTGGTGQVWVTGGVFGESDAELFVGIHSVGRMTVSNGVVFANAASLGSFTNGLGVLTLPGGTFEVYSNMTLGDCSLPSTGNVTVAGGTLTVTNLAGTGVFELRDGTLTLNSGTMRVDKIVITNACAHFVRTGGTLIYGSAVLNPNDDTDGDGLPNGWEMAHGLDPLDPNGVNGANGDPDGDGFTNLQEYENGSDPQDPNSTPFRITSIVKQGNNVMLTWTTLGGKTNVVQFTKGSVGGTYSNNFADLSGNIISNVVGLTSETYLDVGGATNRPVRFYRVRLVP